MAIGLVLESVDRPLLRLQLTFQLPNLFPLKFHECVKATQAERVCIESVDSSSRHGLILLNQIPTMPRSRIRCMASSHQLKSRPGQRRSKSSGGLSAVRKRQFQQRLLKWYREYGRDLPWRKTSNPYHILVSEVMLQQTQVDRVIPKYHEFLKRYPSFEELAGSPLKDVKKTWYPLGYNVRPERLHSIACETVERYGGELPRAAEELLSFKGIGRYTAGAIRSFAFNEDAPILDTNVSRVLHRLFIARGEPKAQKAELWRLSEALIPRGKGYDFNQAIMDFGALLCTARDPYCLLCPMKSFCKTYPFDTKTNGTS